MRSYKPPGFAFMSGSKFLLFPSFFAVFEIFV